MPSFRLARRSMDSRLQWSLASTPAAILLPFFGDGELRACPFGLETQADLTLFRPSLCPEYAPKAETMLLRCIEILGLLREAWPVSERWHRALLQLVIPPPGTSSAGLNVSAHHAQDLDKRVSRLLEVSHHRILTLISLSRTHRPASTGTRTLSPTPRRSPLRLISFLRQETRPLALHPPKQAPTYS
jgi:hypothetical protein